MAFQLVPVPGRGVGKVRLLVGTCSVMQFPRDVGWYHVETPAATARCWFLFIHWVVVSRGGGHLVDLRLGLERNWTPRLPMASLSHFVDRICDSSGLPVSPSEGSGGLV